MHRRIILGKRYYPVFHESPRSDASKCTDCAARKLEDIDPVAGTHLCLALPDCFEGTPTERSCHFVEDNPILR